MKLGNLKLSYPFKEYEALVKHFTTRKSTAIEWCVLELAKKAQNDSVFSGVTLSSVFEHILKISDPDLLIKPCLISLEDLNAIRVNNLCDQTLLEELRLSDIELTDTGKEMQEKGLLPGVENEEIVKIMYDLSTHSIIKKPKGKYDLEAEGYEVKEIEDTIVFPRSLVIQYLEECKKTRKYQWLQETSKINDAREQSSILKWRNVDTAIEVNDGVTIKLRDIKDTDVVNELVFRDEIKGSLDERVSGHLYCDEIQNNVSEMFLLKDISGHIQNVLNAEIQNNPLRGKGKKVSKIFIDSRFLDEDVNIDKIGLKVIYNADEFKLNIENKKIVLEIPEGISNEGCILLSENANIFVGKVDLSNNFGGDTFNLGYKKINHGLNENEIISNIIDNYMNKDYRMAVIAMVKSQKMLLDKIKLNISDMSSLKDQINRINDIQNLCKDVFDKKISDELTNLYKELIYAGLLENVEVNSFETVANIYGEYKELEGKINDFKVSKYLRDTLIQNIKYPKTQLEIAEIYKLLFKKEQGKRVEELKVLYTYPVIKNMYDNFKDKEEASLVNVTSIEANYINMKKVIKDLEVKLPGIDMYAPINSRIILEKIVENKHNILDIKNLCFNWNNYVNRLKEFVDIELLQQDCELNEVFENMKKILDELAIFIKDESIKYQRVLVLDTCSIMENSKLIESLVKKNLVVIPSIVLKELDKHKIEDDEEIKFKARQANRVIESISEKIKIENANLELVPKDLIDEDYANGDNNVLATAIKYIAKKVTLITEDINLRNKAKSQEIDTMSFEEIYKLVGPKESKNKKGGKKK